MRRFALLILAVPALLCVHPSDAAVVERLYEAEVPVTDQGAAARDDALRRALSAVLVKATGRRDLQDHDALGSMLDDAGRYLQQFGYQRREALDPETGEPREMLHLWARFDAVGVQRALMERGIPVWGRERPATLVWLAYDDGTAREVVTPESPQVFTRALSDAASARGVPLIHPLMDLEDRAALPFSVVWGAFEESLRDASARYAADAVLAGRLYRVDAERWAARWTLVEDRTSAHRETPPGVLAAVVADGVHWIAGMFASRFAASPGPSDDGRVRVQVDGVDGFGGYARVMRALGDLSMVTGIQPESTREDSVVFVLELRGTAEQLDRSIALGDRLVPHDDGHSAEWGAPLLRYRLRP